MKTLSLILLVCSLAWSSTVSDSISAIIKSAHDQTEVTYMYDPRYVKIKYPGGDVPVDRGVCTDVIIRAFRAAGLDLQMLVHQDMSQNFSLYPDIWGLKNPDTNIDHRRVPNLMKFFERKGKSLPLSKNPADYIPGDIVTWKIPGNLDHIGLVVDTKVKGTELFAIIHNIGNGAELEDVLFEFSITGHYRYFGLAGQ